MAQMHQLPQLQTQQSPDLLQQVGQFQNLRNLMQQGQIGDQRLQQEQLQTQGMQQQMSRSDAIRQAVQAAGGDYEKALPDIMKIDPEKAAAIGKQMQDWKNSGTEGRIKILDETSKKFGVLGQLAGTVKDPQSLQVALQQAVQVGALDPSEAQDIASKPFDPAMVQQWQQQA